MMMVMMVVPIHASPLDDHDDHDDYYFQLTIHECNATWTALYLMAHRQIRLYADPDDDDDDDDDDYFKENKAQ